MQNSLAFLLGLLAQDDPVYVSAEDFAGEHAPALSLWQRLGFLGSDPEWHPCPNCPHCQEGVPSLLGGRYICGTCHSVVERGELLVRRMKLGALLTWLTRKLQLDGEYRQVDNRLWQLGSLDSQGSRTEYFFCRRGVPSERGRNRLLAYQATLLLTPLPQSKTIAGFQGSRLSLLELLRQDRRSLRIGDPEQFLQRQPTIRFDPENGSLSSAGRCLGDVAPGSKEHALLQCLWQNLDRFVPYADLKRFVLAHTGSRDSTEEATFCQRLKSRLKKVVPEIDSLIATTNKGHGYRLRGIYPNGTRCI